ncbi:MAG: pitrilysin family protein [Spirochaetota bacterium]
MLRLAAVLTAFIAASFAAPSYHVSNAVIAGASQTTLENGLTVIIHEDFRSPLVAVRCYVLTGSIHEDTWLGSGLSHFFEHALFLGTTSRPDQRRIAADIESLGGGNFNAYTTIDHTCYLFTVSANGCEEGLSILADMIGNSVFPAAAVKAEQGTIHKEMAMGEDNADRVFSRFFSRSFFTESPYRYPVIGYRDIYDRLTTNDIHAYYRTRYVPNNMVLVIAGGIARGKALEAAKKTFGPLARKPIRDLYVPDEPPHTARREFIDRSRVTKVPMVEIGFQTVSVFHEDMYPLDLLASILSEENIGILEKELVEKNIAYRAQAQSWTPRSRGVFSFYAELMPERTYAEYERAVFSIIEKIGKGLPAGVLDRAKNTAIVHAIRSRESVDGIAGALGGNYIWAGNPLFDETYLNGIVRVTADDIARVIKRYFVKEKETLVALLPAGTEEKTKRVETAAAAERAVTAVLPNGMTVVARRTPARTISAAALFRGGLVAEDASNNGIHNLLATTMARGSVSFPKEKLFSALNSRGGTLTGESGNYYCALKVKMLAADAREALTILASALREPTLTEEEIGLVKKEAEHSLKRSERDAFYQGGMRFRSRIYAEHPYARPSLGTTNTIARITRNDVVSLHKKAVTGKNIVLAIAGDMPSDALISMVRAAFGPIAAGMVNELSSLPTPEMPTRTFAEPMPGFAQSIVNIGMPGPHRYSPDYYPAEILCNILDGMGGRLFTAVRGDNSLAYSVGCYQSPKLGSGVIVLYAAVEAAEKKAPLAASLMQSELDRLMKSMSDGELTRARNIAVTEMDRGLQDTAFEAFELALRVYCSADPNDLYRSRELFEKVTRDDLAAMYKRYFGGRIQVIAGGE